MKLTAPGAEMHGQAVADECFTETCVADGLTRSVARRQKRKLVSGLVEALRQAGEEGGVGLAQGGGFYCAGTGEAAGAGGGTGECSGGLGEGGEDQLRFARGGEDDGEAGVVGGFREAGGAGRDVVAEGGADAGFEELGGEVARIVIGGCEQNERIVF